MLRLRKVFPTIKALCRRLFSAQLSVQINGNIVDQVLKQFTTPKKSIVDNCKPSTASTMEIITKNSELSIPLEIGEVLVVQANGETYRGGFENGKRHGLGKVTDPQGIASLEGVWKDGKLHEAHGSILMPDGSRRHGIWVGGKRHGPGKNVDPKGNVTLEGEWKDGKIYNGHGTLLTFGGSTVHGTWVKGKKEGPGKIRR